jgi:hypothetical protein
LPVQLVLPEQTVLPVQLVLPEQTVLPVQPVPPVQTVLPVQRVPPVQTAQLVQRVPGVKLVRKVAQPVQWVRLVILVQVVAQPDHKAQLVQPAQPAQPDQLDLSSRYPKFLQLGIMESHKQIPVAWEIYILDSFQLREKRCHIVMFYICTIKEEIPAQTHLRKDGKLFLSQIRNYLTYTIIFEYNNNSAIKIMNKNNDLEKCHAKCAT